MGENNDKLKSMALGYFSEAQKCFSVGDYGKSYAFLLLVLKLVPNLKSHVESEFCESWRRWSEKLFNLKKFKELIDLYQQGCEIFCECEGLHTEMAEYFYKIGHKLGAHTTYQRALHINPMNMTTYECLDNLCREIIDNWHYPMLNDKERNSKFQLAIQERLCRLKQVKECVDVIDIGSGTGIMSIFAAQAGADNVTACEMCPVMSKIGEDVIEGNGVEESITSSNYSSTELHVQEQDCSSNGHSTLSDNVLPRRMSLGICEILDAGVFGEGIMKTLDHAWKNILLPPEEGGYVIPAKVKIKMMCIECEEINQKHCGGNFVMKNHKSIPILLSSNVGIVQDTTNEKECPFDQEPYTSESMTSIDHKRLSEYHTAQEVNFDDPEQIFTLVTGQDPSIIVHLEIIEDGFLDAIISCFELDLLGDGNPDYILKTDIGSNLCWEQTVYPIRCIKKDDNMQFTRVSVCKHDKVTLNLIQQHDKILLHSCEVLKTNGKHEILPQLFLQDFCKQINVSLFTLKEEDILHYNNGQFMTLCTNAFSDWLKSRKHCFSTNGTQRSLQSGDGVLKTNSTMSSYNGTQNHLSLLDMTSNFTKLPFKLAMDHDTFAIHKIWRHEYMNCDIMQKYGNTGNLSNIHFLKDFSPNHKYDAIFIDVVEHSGLLLQDVFSNLMQARLSLKEDGRIFPSQIMVMGMLFDSTELLCRCSIQDTENTMGINVGDYLQSYQATTLSHIEICKVKHTSLSNPNECMMIDLNCSNPSNVFESSTTINMNIHHSGTVHGIFIWFVIKVDEKHLFDTSEPTNPWLQSAIMFKRDKNLKVTAGDCLQLTVRHNHSYIAVDIDESSK